MICSIQCNNNYDETHIINKFEEEFDKYTKSSHCRASYKITNNIKKYFVNELKSNINNFKNKSFEEIFNLVYRKIVQPIENGGGKIINGKRGQCGIGIMGNYDITIAIIRSIPRSKLPEKIFLIKDKTKGPWNYTIKVLKLKPKKIENMNYNNIYYIDKEIIIKTIIQNDVKLLENVRIKDLKNMDCDDLESYFCICWKKYKINNLKK